MKAVPTVLLIDDDPDFVEATCAVLESAPYEVLIAYDGSQGLAMAQETHPDVILLDVIMPVEDGFQTLEKLRADPALADVPVMILTSLPNGLSLVSTGESYPGIVDYVDKPVKPAELLQRVGRLLSLGHIPNVSDSAQTPRQILSEALRQSETRNS
jgi:CheY-like chemotaxis protein